MYGKQATPIAMNSHVNQSLPPDPLFLAISPTLSAPTYAHMQHID